MEPLKDGLELFAAGKVEEATRIWLKFQAESPTAQVAAYLKHVSSVEPEVYARISDELAKNGGQSDPEDNASHSSDETVVDEQMLAPLPLEHTPTVAECPNPITAETPAHTPEAEDITEITDPQPQIAVPNTLPLNDDITVVTSEQPLNTVGAQSTILVDDEPTVISTVLHQLVGTETPTEDIEETVLTTSPFFAPDLASTRRSTATTDVGPMDDTSTLHAHDPQPQAHPTKPLASESAPDTSTNGLENSSPDDPHSNSTDAEFPQEDSDKSAEGKAAKSTPTEASAPIIDTAVHDPRTSKAEPQGQDITALARTIRKDKEQPKFAARITGSFSRPSIDFQEATPSAQDERTVMAEDPATAAETIEFDDSLAETVVAAVPEFVASPAAQTPSPVAQTPSPAAQTPPPAAQTPAVAARSPLELVSRALPPPPAQTSRPAQSSPLDPQSNDTNANLQSTRIDGAPESAENFDEFGSMVDSLESETAPQRNREQDPRTLSTETPHTDPLLHGAPPPAADPSAVGGAAPQPTLSNTDITAGPPPAVGLRKAASMQSVQQLEEKLRDFLELDDFSGALETSETILASFPNHTEARTAQVYSREKLLSMHMSKMGDPSTIPRLLRSADELIWLDLDHRAGFVLAQIDGVSSFADIVELTGMDSLESYQILAKLVQDGVIG